MPVFEGGTGWLRFWAFNCCTQSFRVGCTSTFAPTTAPIIRFNKTSHSWFFLFVATFFLFGGNNDNKILSPLDKFIWTLLRVVILFCSRVFFWKTFEYFEIEKWLVTFGGNKRICIFSLNCGNIGLFIVRPKNEIFRTKH